MKILYLIPTLGSGGAERQLSIIAPALARAGVEVHVAYCRGGPNLGPLENSGVQLHLLPSLCNHDPILLWKIIRLVRRLQPDVVQTWLLQMDILGGVASLLNRVPLIVSERSSAAAYVPGWKTRLRLLVGRRANCLIANSCGGIDYWRPYLPQDRLHLVRNCVTQGKHLVAKHSETQLMSQSEQPLIVFAGRFSYEKNIPNLVEALILVARQNLDTFIMMFGEGPEREFAARRIVDAGLSNRIIVAGYSADLATWMARASACVSVSHFEGHPNIVMEAAAAGCPLILSDIAAHREMFDETSALLVPADSPQLIAEALLTSLQDQDSARKRALHASGIAAKNDLPATIAAYLAIYDNVVVNGTSR